MSIQEELIFIVCCGVGTAVDVCLLNILVRVMNIKEETANIISYIVGVVVAFFLCRSYVFVDKQGGLGIRLILDLIGHIISLFVQQKVLKVLLKKGRRLNVAKIATIAVNAILMYFFTKFVFLLELEVESI